MHFAQAAVGVDCWQDVSLLLPIDDAVPAEAWSDTESCAEEMDIESQPEANAQFSELPGELSRPKTLLGIGHLTERPSVSQPRSSSCGNARC